MKVSKIKYFLIAILTAIGLQLVLGASIFELLIKYRVALFFIFVALTFAFSILTIAILMPVIISPKTYPDISTDELIKAIGLIAVLNGIIYFVSRYIPLSEYTANIDLFAKCIIVPASVILIILCIKASKE